MWSKIWSLLDYLGELIALQLYTGKYDAKPIRCEMRELSQTNYHSWYFLAYGQGSISKFLFRTNNLFLMDTIFPILTFHRNI